jgi:methylenetetrahydrofolate reductase (NADPH)
MNDASHPESSRRAATQPDSFLARSLRAGAFVITAEVVPPASCEADDLIAKALPLRGLADAVNVTDGAGARAHMGATAAAAILAQNGIEPILQLACRDRNRIALQGELMGAAALGIRNLLLLRGDDPTAGDQKDAKPVFDLDSRALMEMARAMRDHGSLPHGQAVAGNPGFFLGAADAPIDPAPDWKPTTLAGKIESGAQFAQTQFCMDIGVVRRYVARLAEAGLTDKLFLLVGVNPLRSARSARWMKQNLFGTIIPDAFIERLEAAQDPAAEGAQICVDLIQELAQTPGVAGVHVMAPGNDAGVPAVIAAARRALPLARQSHAGERDPDQPRSVR